MTTMHRLHPDMQVLVDAREPLPENAPISHQRQRWTRYAKKLSKPIPASLSVTEEEIPTHHRNVPVRIYRKNEKTDSTSCIIYMHGGGFMLGDLDSSDSIAWGFAD